MKKYVRTWNSKLNTGSNMNWASLSNPMCLKITEDKKSDIFIAASLEFSGLSPEKLHRAKIGSLYYKIEVNGEPLVQYHVSNSRINQKTNSVNLHGRTQIPPGENTVEVFYRASENSSTELLKYQKYRELSVLTFPEE